MNQDAQSADRDTSGAQEKAMLKKFARWAYRFSPLVALDEVPKSLMKIDSSADARFHGINIDISGCSKLFEKKGPKENGEVNIVWHIHEALKRASISGRYAIAPTLGSAWALSRYGQKRLEISFRQDLKEALKPLPVSALRVSAKTESTLSELNVQTIDDLFRIPPKSLLSRLDSEVIARLNQALGYEDEVLQPISLPEFPQARIAFSGPTVQLEAIRKATLKLLDVVLEQLMAREKKPLRLLLHVERYDATPIFKDILLSLANSSRKHLWSLLDSQIEKLHLGFGVEALTLIVTQEEKISSYNASYLRDDQEKVESLQLSQKKAEVLDTLFSQLGASRVLGFEFHESHVPENSFRYVTASQPPQKSFRAVLNADRPSVLLGRPEKIRAMAVVPDSPPFWLQWRGQKYSVAQALGPERIGPEWWKKEKGEPETQETLTKGTRDYFKVQLPSGMWVWIFRELETSEWFLHGLWS